MEKNKEFYSDPSLNEDHFTIINGILAFKADGATEAINVTTYQAQQILKDAGIFYPINWEEELIDYNVEKQKYFDLIHYTPEDIIAYCNAASKLNINPINELKKIFKDIIPVHYICNYMMKVRTFDIFPTSKREMEGKLFLSIYYDYDRKTFGTCIGHYVYVEKSQKVKI
jgi:hypothetical protein